MPVKEIDVLLNPKSVAVIGASRDAASVGHGVLKSLLTGCVFDTGECKGFGGKIFPINPKADEILGVKCYPSITAVPEPVDVAVVAVPAKIVPGVVKECGAKGVKAIAIISSGFAETGEEGRRLQEEVAAAARQAGIRVLGPNCLGILRPPIFLNASFALAMPPSGDVAFITQSGAMADSVIDWAIKERYTFSGLVSLGNMSDLDAADFVEWFAADEGTKAIAVYLEWLRDGKKFMRAVCEATKKKPVIVLKGGRTSAGGAAIRSHTGALAGSYEVYTAAVRQCGGMVADSVEELFELAEALSEMPRARENAVAVVTNAGGPGVLCADYCERLGIKLVELRKETVEKLDSTGVMHPAYSKRNPLDIVGDALPNRYEAAINTLLGEEYVQGLIVIQTLQTMTDPVADAKIIIDAHKKFPSKPIVCVFMGGKFTDPSIQLLHQNKIPTYNDPLKGAEAMAALCGLL